MASLSYETEEEWKAIRSKHIGASEISALFGLSPWLTRWQLFMLKTGKLPDVFETKVMSQGRHFEPAVASYAQEKFALQLRKVKRYLSHDDVPGLGASLDYEAFGDGSLIPTELKWSLYGDGWEYDGDELTSVPEYYLLQCQHQLACMPSAPHAQLIAFTGGDLKRMVIPRSERLITAIRDAVASFWADVAAGNEPPVDFSADADAVSRLAYLSRLRSVTLMPEAAPLFERYTEAAAQEKDAEGRKDAARAELLKLVIDSGEGSDDKTKATCGLWKMSIAKIQETPGKEVTQDMVGTLIGARKGYVRATISKSKD